MLDRVQRKGNPLTLLVVMQQPLWIKVWRFLKKQEIELPYDPAIPLLGIHTEETRIERDKEGKLSYSGVKENQQQRAIQPVFN